MKRILLFIGIVLIFSNINGQKIRFQKTRELPYYQLALKPLPTEYKTYNINIICEDPEMEKYLEFIEVKKLLNIEGYEQVESEGDFTLKFILGNFELAGYEPKQEIEKLATTGGEKKITKYFYTLKKKFHSKLVFVNQKNNILYEEEITSPEIIDAGTFGYHENQNNLKVDFENEKGKYTSRLKKIELENSFYKANEILVNKYSYINLKVVSNIAFFKPAKKTDYADYFNMKDKAINALNFLFSSEGSEQYLDSLIIPINFWKNKIQNANPKKDKDIIDLANYNLAVMYMWMGDYDKAWEFIRNVREGFASSSSIGSYKGDLRKVVYIDIINRRARHKAHQ